MDANAAPMAPAGANAGLDAAVANVLLTPSPSPQVDMSRQSAVPVPQAGFAHQREIPDNKQAMELISALMSGKLNSDVKIKEFIGYGL